MDTEVVMVPVLMDFVYPQSEQKTSHSKNTFYSLGFIQIFVIHVEQRIQAWVAEQYLLSALVSQENFLEYLEVNY